MLAARVVRESNCHTSNKFPFLQNTVDLFQLYCFLWLTIRFWQSLWPLPYTCVHLWMSLVFNILYADRPCNNAFIASYCVLIFTFAASHTFECARTNQRFSDLICNMLLAVFLCLIHFPIHRAHLLLTIKLLFLPLRRLYDIQVNNLAVDTCCNFPNEITNNGQNPKTLICNLRWYQISYLV